MWDFTHKSANKCDFDWFHCVFLIKHSIGSRLTQNAWHFINCLVMTFILLFEYSIVKMCVCWTEHLYNYYSLHRSTESAHHQIHIYDCYFHWIGLLTCVFVCSFCLFEMHNKSEWRTNSLSQLFKMWHQMVDQIKG